MHTTQLRPADLNLLIVLTVLAEERNVTRAAARVLLSHLSAARCSDYETCSMTICSSGPRLVAKESPL